MRRFGRVLAVLAVVLAITVVGVFWAGERWGRPRAEAALAEAVRVNIGLARTPAVSITGSPFVLRAAQGHFTSVSGEVDSLDAQGLTLAPVRIELDNVRFSPSKALNRESDVDLQIAKARVVATVSDRELSRYLAAQGAAVTVRIERGQAQLAGLLEVVGFTAAVSGSAKLALSDGHLVLQPIDVKIAGADLPPIVRQQIERLLTVDVVLPELSSGVRATDAHLQSGSLTLTADVTERIRSEITARRP